MFGGRGASSGISEKGNKYGTQYETVKDKDGNPLVFGNIKFVKKKDRNAETLMETMTNDRIYAYVGGDDLISIIMFDKKNKRNRQIDVKGPSHNDILPHVHRGYEHSEKNNNDFEPTDDEKKLVDYIKKLWYKHLNGK